ncbi:MAG: GNAT family N-acetyltransferase [Chloroflexi bacterium]|nr:GNAT family N-acetyltransferase [Chloroflexota bacterium]
MTSEIEHTPRYAIRLARRDELTKLPAIELAAAQLFHATTYTWISSDTGMALADFEHWLVNGKLWVAVDATDEPVGFAVAHEVDGNAYLHELDIDPKHGRQGLGARLIDTVAAWAQTSGYRAVTLSTFADVAWNAPYYRRLGFRVLDDDELGPGLREVRAHEAEVGLTNRVYMLRPVG